MAAIRKDNKLMALLSVWGILLVLIGHSGFEEPIIQQKLCYLHSWIYSFHMPLFFMISGYLFSLTNEDFSRIKAGVFLQKKVVRLLVPYVALGAILWVIKYAFSGLSHASRDFSLGTFFKMFVAPGCEGSTMGYLWYVFTLFVMFVVVVALGKIRVNLKKVGGCFIVMFACWAFYACLPNLVWLNWSKVCLELPFFLTGVILQRYEARFSSLVNRGGYYAFAILCALSVGMLFVSSPAIGCFNYVIKAFVGMLMSIQCCSILLRFNWVEKYLLPLSKYTYSISLLSWFGHYAAKVVLVNMLHVHWLIVVCGMFLAGLVLPLMVCRIVDKAEWGSKQKWLRTIIGY